MSAITPVVVQPEATRRPLIMTWAARKNIRRSGWSMKTAGNCTSPSAVQPRPVISSWIAWKRTGTAAISGTRSNRSTSDQGRQWPRKQRSPHTVPQAHGGFLRSHRKPIQLLYYPRYHSKYNPVERCWGILEKHWNGAMLANVDTMLGWAKSMT